MIIHCVYRDAIILVMGCNYSGKWSDEFGWFCQFRDLRENGVAGIWSGGDNGVTWAKCLAEHKDNAMYSTNGQRSTYIIAYIINNPTIGILLIAYWFTLTRFTPLIFRTCYLYNILYNLADTWNNS